jgi:hypothetical protein
LAQYLCAWHGAIAEDSGRSPEVKSTDTGRKDNTNKTIALPEMGCEEAV